MHIDRNTIDIDGSNDAKHRVRAGGTQTEFLEHLDRLTPHRNFIDSLDF
jgi:hypothetical protein